MLTYKIIIKKILNTDNNIFFRNYKNDGIDVLLKTCFNVLLNSEITTKNKYTFFIDMLNDIFLKGKEQDFINYFCKIQKTYLVLNRFVYNYKYKKAQTVVNTDMCLNELRLNEPNVICLFDNGSKYFFQIKDLIKIIETGLTNSYMFFAEPVCSKNPYNNIPFNKSILYNIYFFVRYNTHLYSELLFKFFDCDFNLSLFKMKNEYILRAYTINNYVYKSPSNTLVDEIKDMIEMFNHQCRLSKLKIKIKIDKDFPIQTLIRVMQPYLLLYCTSQYAYLQHEKNEASYFFKQGFRNKIHNIKQFVFYTATTEHFI